MKEIASDGSTDGYINALEAEIERLSRQVDAMVEAGVMTETEARDFVLDDMRAWGKENDVWGFRKMIDAYEKDRGK